LRVLWKCPPTGRPSPAARLVRENRARGGDADRVREDEAVRLHLGDAFCDLDDAVGTDLAFERATERHAERDRAAEPVTTRA